MPTTPWTDARKAGKSTSPTLRTPTSPCLIGRDTWHHWSSVRATLTILSKVCLNVRSNWATSSGHNQVGAVLSKYVTFGTDILNTSTEPSQHERRFFWAVPEREGVVFGILSHLERLRGKWVNLAKIKFARTIVLDQEVRDWSQKKKNGLWVHKRKTHT